MPTPASPNPPNDAAHAAEMAARMSYGRLVSFLASEGWELTRVEDALADALLIAIERWAREGIPRSPDGWLLTTAKRKLIDAARHDTVAARALPVIHAWTGRHEHASHDDPALAHLDARTPQESIIPDRRLELLFMCAHPAIDPAARTPLMLQTVLGLDARAIAAAFLVSPAAMAQRLVRAKAKIRDANVPFVKPLADDLPPRLDAVLQAVYAAFGAAYDDAAGEDPTVKGLADKAIALAAVLADLLPEEPEPRALLALMLHCEARRTARRVEGVYVPLASQECSRWSRPMIAEAESHLRRAADLVASRGVGAEGVGRFGIEASIQSAHAARLDGSAVPWSVIVALYDALMGLEPAGERWIGARVSRAAALREAVGPRDCLAALDEVAALAETYQPYWAVRAEALAALGDHAGSMAALDRSIGLSNDGAVRDFLLAKRENLRRGSSNPS